MLQKLKEKGLIAYFIKALTSVVAYLEKYQIAARGAVIYENSNLFFDVVRGPKIRLCETGVKETRLNVVLPSFYEDECYGGPVSALELTFQISKNYSAIRFVSQGALKMDKKLVNLKNYIENSDVKNIQITSLADEPEFICHQHEIFLCTYYSTVKVWELYSDLLSRKGLNKNPFYYVIQDFEPGFYPFGYHYSLAMKTYSHGMLTHAIFNSRELYAFFEASFPPFCQMNIITPSLNAGIYEYLCAREFTIKSKGNGGKLQILIYGRPAVHRNCYQSILAGLFEFFSAMSLEERKKYCIVSAGASHDDIELCRGVHIRSLGKLTMESYIEVLENSHIGISFMASPHPSYPPLEMAAFGLYTITNKFLNKDISTTHPMIHCLNYPLPDELARELTEAVKYVLNADSISLPATIPTNMSSLPWEENLKTIQIDSLTSANLS